MHSSVKPTIARGQHWFNRRYYLLSDSFFSNGSIGLAVYISAPMASIQLSLDSPDIIHTLLSFESNKEHNSSSFNLSSHQDLSEDQDIDLVHSYLVFDPAQVNGRACYSWWLAAPRRSSWSRSFEAYRGDCGSPKEVLVILFMVWAPPCRDGERRLLVSAFVLVTWEVTRPLVGVTTWIRGDCQIIDTTRKKSSCPL
jgi:hypothetical protein